MTSDQPLTPIGARLSRRPIAATGRAVHWALRRARAWRATQQPRMTALARAQQAEHTSSRTLQRFAWVERIVQRYSSPEAPVSSRVQALPLVGASLAPDTPPAAESAPPEPTLPSLSASEIVERLRARAAARTDSGETAPSLTSQLREIRRSHGSGGAPAPLQQQSSTTSRDEPPAVIPRPSAERVRRFARVEEIGTSRPDGASQPIKPASASSEAQQTSSPNISAAPQTPAQRTTSSPPTTSTSERGDAAPARAQPAPTIQRRAQPAPSPSAEPASPDDAPPAPAPQTQRTPLVQRRAQPAPPPNHARLPLAHRRAPLSVAENIKVASEEKTQAQRIATLPLASPRLSQPPAAQVQRLQPLKPESTSPQSGDNETRLPSSNRQPSSPSPSRAQSNAHTSSQPKPAPASLDLEALASAVMPFVRRLLRIERERWSGL